MNHGECPDCGTPLRAMARPNVRGLVGCLECLRMFWPDELARARAADVPPPEAGTYDPASDWLDEPFPEEMR